MITIKNYQLDPELFYEPQDHFWLKVKDNRARIGMDPLVQESMGAFVVIQIHEKGTTLNRGDSFGTVEAEKFVGPLRAPVSGTIMQINKKVVQNPRLVNSDPYGEGWLIELKLSNFEHEKDALVNGEAALRSWFAKEIEKYEDAGWLAEM